MNWDDYFISLLPTIASKSKDESTKNAAIIVGEDNELISSGYNSFVRGLDDNIKERQTRPLKYKYFEHAERNAIYNAARCGIKTKGCTMYISAFPCSDCTRAIIQSGIKRIVIFKRFSDALSNYNTWEEDFIISQKMLRETEVKIDWYEGELQISTHFICRGEIIK